MDHTSTDDEESTTESDQTEVEQERSDESSIDEVTDAPLLWSVYYDFVVSPKPTYQRLLHSKNRKWVNRSIYLLVILFGIIPEISNIYLSIPDVASMNLYYAVKELLTLFFVKIVIAVTKAGSMFIGVTALLYLVGRKVLDTDVNYRDYAIVVSWSSIPYIVLSLISLVIGLFYQVVGDPSSFNPMEGLGLLVTVSLVVLSVVAAIWSILLELYGIYILQSSNIIKLMFNIVIPILFIFTCMVVWFFIL